MAGVSIITQARNSAEYALRLCHISDSTWIIARDKVYEIHKAAKERRDSYQNNKRVRDEIAAIQVRSWEIVELMDRVAEEWDQALARRIQPYLLAVVSNINMTGTSDGVNMLVESLKMKVEPWLKPIERPEPQLPDAINLAIAKLVNQQHLTAEPDPEDRMDDEV